MPAANVTGLISGNESDWPTTNQLLNNNDNDDEDEDDSDDDGNI